MVIYKVKNQKLKATKIVEISILFEKCGFLVFINRVKIVFTKTLIAFEIMKCLLQMDHHYIVLYLYIFFTGRAQ